MASKNRAGSYFRTKVTPINPETSYQVNARNRFGGRSTAWRGLNQNQIKAWNAAVGDFARTDIFGDLRNPSGFNLHQKLNNNLVNIGESEISTPPLPVSVDSFASMHFTALVAGSLVTLYFSPAVGDDHKVLVFATPNLSPGISFAKSEFRQISVLPASQDSPVDLKTPYGNKFGLGLTLGKKIFIYLVQVVMATGQAGIPIQASAIIEAGG